MMTRRTRSEVKVDCVKEIDHLLVLAKEGDLDKAKEAKGFLRCMELTDMFKNAHGDSEYAGYKKRIAALLASATEAGPPSA